jgi:hypothetical protein
MKQWEIRQASADDDAVTIANPGADPALDDVPHLLLVQAPIIVWTTDWVLNFTSSDGSGLEELMLGPNQIVDLTLFDLFDSDDPRLPVIAAHLRALAGQTVSFDMRLADRLSHGRVSPLEDSEGEQIGTICAVVEAASADPAVVGTISRLVTVG